MCGDAKLEASSCHILDTDVPPSWSPPPAFYADRRGQVHGGLQRQKEGKCQDAKDISGTN